MLLFDVLFLLLAGVAVVTLCAAAVTALAGHRATAGRLVRRVALGALAYLGVVYAVAVGSPGRVLALGEDACSDDWCLAVTGVREAADGPGGSTWEASFRVSSRALRVTQRERSVAVWARDASGHRYAAEAGPGDAPFDVALGPGDAVVTRRRFVLPPGTEPREIELGRSGFPFPGCLVFGEATEILHRPVVRLR